MKHNLLTSANGFCTPPCLDSQRKSTISSIYSTLRTSLLALFLLIVGNSAAWGSTNYFTPGKTLYFHVSGDCKNWGSNQFAALFYYQNNENKAYGYENESYSARQFIGNNSIGSSNRIKCTRINDDYYSVVIPSNGTANIGYVRLIHLNTDDGWCHQAEKKVSADSFTGTNNCAAFSGWDDADPSGFEAYNSGECITSACGAAPEPAERAISTDYRLRGDLWAYDNSGNWAGKDHNPELTPKPYKETDGTYTFSYIAPVASNNRFSIMIGGGADKTASLAEGSSAAVSTNGSEKYIFNVTSSPKQVDITFNPSTNKAKVLLSDYTPVTTGWYIKSESAVGGLAANTNTAMASDGTITLTSVSAGTYYFYIHNNASELYWGFNKFGGCYVDQTNSTASLISSLTSDAKFGSKQWPIKEVSDRKVKMVVDAGDAGKDIRVSFDGGKILLTAIAPAVSRTVTIHPNNGEANFTMNVADGGTISSIAASYGAGTASWYSDSELITPFTLGSTTVTGDMDLYAKWGVSGNYYVVGDLWMYDAGSNWDNAKAQLMTNTNGVSTVSYTAPKGLNRIEIIKDRDWGQKINGGSYSAVINASSPVSLSESGGHIVFTLTEAKRVTITFDGKVSVNATDYSFDQSVDWRVKTSDSGWGNNPNTWDHSNVMTKTTSGASIIIRNVPGSTNHSFMITRGSDEQAVVGTYNFNALWLDTSSPSTGLTWNMQNTNIGDRQLAQTDNEWRNCSFRLSEQSDVRITFDGGVIRMDILPKYTVTFDSDGGTAVASQTLYEGLAATEPGDPTKAGGFTFNYWKLSGESSEYDFSTPVTCNITLVADWTAPASLQELIDATAANGTLTLTSNYNEDAVIDKAITINGDGHTIGNLTVEQTGDLTLSSGLTVNDFTICAKAGNTSNPAASGQVRNAANLTVNGNAYFLYTVDPSGHVQYGWYDFTVPFPVNAASGIKGIENSVMKNDFANGVDYAIMEYLGEKQGQGQYPYKKFSGVMQPNKLYSITLDDEHNYNTLRMQKTADGALVAGDNVTVTLNAYAGDAQHQNWNGVGNGTLHHANAGVSAEYIQVYQSGNKTFLTINKSEYSFVVGTAFMVQGTGTMTLNQATHDKLLAPKRYADAPATAIQIASDGQPFSDQLFISASETGGQAYTPGVDVAKAGTLGGANVPQIWTNAYNSALCVHEAQLINGEAQYDISLYAPAAGNYTLTSKNIPADYTLYLTQNGTTLCELSEAYTFDLSQGITTEYGLLLVESHKMPTGIENIQGDEVQSAKIMHNGILYILHNGKVYNAQGANVK